MASEEILHKTLRNADGKPFAKYKGITNFFTTEAFELLVDEVQNDRAGHSRMRVRVPQTGTMNPAPAERVTSLTLRVHPLGAPLTLESSVRDAWVLAMHTGRLPYPSASIWAMALSASLE